jgi:hypothetical protein
MVKAAPPSAFIVAQSNLLLQFEVVTLDPLAMTMNIGPLVLTNIGPPPGV